MTISEKMADIMELANEMRKDMIAMGWEVPLDVKDEDEGYSVKIEKILIP